MHTHTHHHHQYSVFTHATHMLVKADTAQEEATCYTANLQLI